MLKNIGTKLKVGRLEKGDFSNSTNCTYPLFIPLRCGTNQRNGVEFCNLTKGFEFPYNFNVLKLDLERKIIILNPSRSKEFYNLVRPRGGVKLRPHENHYNFVGFEDFLTKLRGHLEKSITQVWVVKYFWNVTWHRWRHRWRQRRHILRHGF